MTKPQHRGLGTETLCLGTETLCLQLPRPVLPIPSTKASRDGGGLQSPREACHRGGIQEPGRTLLSCYLGLRTCQKVRVAKRNRRSRNSPSGVGSLLQVILEHLEVHLLGSQVPGLPAWPTYLIKDCPCNAYKKCSCRLQEALLKCQGDWGNRGDSLSAHQNWSKSSFAQPSRNGARPEGVC